MHKCGASQEGFSSGFPFLAYSPQRLILSRIRNTELISSAHAPLISPWSQCNIRSPAHQSISGRLGTEGPEWQTTYIHFEDRTRQYRRTHSFVVIHVLITAVRTIGLDHLYQLFETFMVEYEYMQSLL